MILQKSKQENCNKNRNNRNKESGKSSKHSKNTIVIQTITLNIL